MSQKTYWEAPSPLGKSQRSIAGSYPSAGKGKISVNHQNVPGWAQTSAEFTEIHRYLASSCLGGQKPPGTGENPRPGLVGFDPHEMGLTPMEGMGPWGELGRTKSRVQNDAHDPKYFNTTESQFLVQIIHRQKKALKKSRPVPLPRPRIP